MSAKTSRFALPFITGAALALSLGGCGGIKAKSEAKYPTGINRESQADQNAVYAEKPSVFGKGGLRLLGGKGDDAGGPGANGISVNSFLWRAALDTVSFMPLASADPFGGVILTDWYSAPEAKDERFKLNVFILDRQLRSDAIQVKVFRQVKKGGEWRDSEATDETARKLEDAILTRARQMRVAQMDESQ